MLERETSSIGLSLGATAPLVALDTNTNVNVTENRTIRGSSFLYYNLATLLRNVLGSITTPLEQIVGNDLFDICLQEMETTRDYLKGVAPQLELVWYVQDYHQVGRMLPNATLREANTSKQQLEAAANSAILTALHKHLTGESPSSSLFNDTRVYSTPYGQYQEIGLQPNRQVASVLIITHEAHHLLWQTYFGKLYLLESFTGSLKASSAFYSKLATLKDYPLPFNKLTLTLYGDKTAVKPKGIKLRRDFEAIVERMNWTVLTAESTIRECIIGYGSPELKAELL